MENNWICVYQTPKEYKAEIAKEILFENQIQAVSINKKDSSYLFGYIEIYVDKEQALKAKHLLQQMDNEESLNLPDTPIDE
jgi:hypothetical protein